MRGLIHRVTGLFDGTDDQAADEREAESGDPAGLYQCSDCDTTYISREMHTCPECSQAVESVPTESDLGMA